MKKFLKYLYLYSLIVGGSIFLVEWHTGQVSRLIDSFRDQPTIGRDEDALPAKAEVDPANEITRWEKLLQKQAYDTLISETEGRKDPIAKAYRTIAVFESGKHSGLLVEAMGNMKDLVSARDIPASLSTRLVRSLGDPEAPGPTAQENLEAYKDIINSLHIATQASSLKKLAELEALAAEKTVGN